MKEELGTLDLILLGEQVVHSVAQELVSLNDSSFRDVAVSGLKKPV